MYSKDHLNTFPEEHPVLLTEAPINPRRNREKAAEVRFFCDFPLLYLLSLAVPIFSWLICIIFAVPLVSRLKSSVCNPIKDCKDPSL